jgi:hypothetical protein
MDGGGLAAGTDAGGGSRRSESTEEVEGSRHRAEAAPEGPRPRKKNSRSGSSGVFLAGG